MATAFGESVSVAGRFFDLKVYVQELTSDGDIKELAATLRHQGQDGLLSALKKIKYKGRVAPNGSVGTRMRVVRIHPTKDGGQHIVLATNLLISSRDDLLRRECSSNDYISIVELDIDKDGKGTGSYAPLSTVKFNDKNELEIEHYCRTLYRLANVYRQK